MNSLSPLDQVDTEIALLVIEGHVTWTRETIESFITKDIKGINPGFDIDTHVEVYDREKSMFKTMADVTEELTSTQGSGMSVH